MSHSEALMAAKQRMAVAERALRSLVDGPRGEDFYSVHARLLAELKEAVNNYLAVMADIGEPSRPTSR